MFFSVLLIFAAFGGFLLAFYIRHKKKAGETLICPLDSKCDKVIYSEYSKFFGIPVEILGLCYYALIALSYALFLVLPPLATAAAVFGALIFTITAFLFSLYLTFIQIFALKKLCTWCLISAGLCTIIFAAALFSSEFGFTALLSANFNFILILHFLGVALGLGGATIADIFFFKFLKDFRISEWEAEVMRALSQVIWFALAIIILSGIGLYIPNASELNQSPKFLVKMIVVFVLIVNGAFLNLLISPKLVHISFGQKHDHEAGELRRTRKLAFALGAISLISWYSSFFLGMMPRTLSINFWPLLLGYLAVTSGAIIASQLIERFFAQKAPTN